MSANRRLSLGVFNIATMELKAGIVCDRGLNPKRLVNQDRYLAIPDRGLFAVFDGVGGQRAGEVASQSAADTIEEAISHDSAPSPADLIRRAIQFANRDIFEMAESNPEYKTMATTVALLHIQDSKATIAHVGDSRVYRLEDGRLYRETIDHTDLNDDIRLGRLSRERAGEHPERNVINRALGVETEVDVEMKSIAARDGSRFLLCSDGIYSHLSDEEIASVLVEQKDPQRAADELKRIVHQRGADDNLTAVVVQLGRPRQTAVLGIDDGLPRTESPKSVPRTPAPVRVSSAPRPRESRIQVELGSGGRSQASAEAQPSFEPDASAGSPAKAIMYVLLVAVLMAGAFYLGLRTSDWFRKQSGNPPAVLPADPLKKGREAIDHGDLQTASVEFESLVRREPTNAPAHYWLGRVRLEQRDYQQAAQSFEQALTQQPTYYDAYVQAAAAYEAMGDRTKAMAMLNRFAEEKKKEQR
jgi:serine/threonine protein phosphatase PrpC